MARENPVNPSAYPISSQFTTIDAAGASSPVSAGSASAVSITVPSYAAEVHIITSAAIYISENSDMGSLYRLESGMEYIRGVGGMEYIYVKAITVDSTIYFSFALIK